MYADVLAGGISGLYTDVGQARRVQISPAAGAIDLVPLNGCLIALKTHSLVLRHLSMSGLRLDGAPGLQPLLDVFVGVRWPALRTFELSLAAECRSVGCDGLARVVATNCEHIECLRWERAPVRPSTLANLLRSLRFLTEIHVSIDDSHDGPLDALQTRLYDAISESMLYDDAQPHDQWRYSQHVPLTPHSARASIVASIPATPRTPSHLAPPSPRASLAMPPASPQKPQQLPPASPRKSLQMPPVSPRLSSLAPASASASASASTSASASALIVPTSTSVPTLIAPASVTPASASASAPVHHRRSSVAQPTIAELAAAADALGLDNDDDYAFLDNEAALLRPSRRSFADPASEGLTVPARGFASRSPLLPASPAASAFDGPLPSKPVGFRRPRRTSEQQSSSRVDSMRQSLILPPIYQISYHRHRPPPLRILRFLTISVFDAGHAAGAIASGSVSWLRDLRALLQQAPLLGVDVNVVYRAERHSLRGPATTSGRVRQADRAVGRLKANLRLLFT
ncbi:hypothetical protein GQ42DRAFT_2237 [Ramicandelaber brevisporus]|nr:hypothetical protein GQ42DRAFT_2237 [Ramicandelaber brevisporus]